MRIAENIGELIGHTPLVRIKFSEIPDHVKIYGKLEGDNPGGSVKDRPAYNMIKKALERGEIDQSTKLVEATSGNTGIALAMVACALNIDITLIMPENSTKERVDTMKAYGAKVILTEAAKTIEYSRTVAETMVSDQGYYMLNQFGNKDNYLAHYQTTGPEIWDDTNESITHFVSSMGTTGTIMGTSMFLKQKNPKINIIGVQPEEGSQIPGIRKWSKEFLPTIYDENRVDNILFVSREDSISMTKRLAAECGIFAGISSGGAMLSAVRMSKEMKEPATIVSIVCDRGDRYLSEGFFD